MSAGSKDYYKMQDSLPERLSIHADERREVLKLVRLGIEGRFSEITFNLAHMDERTVTIYAAVAISILAATIKGTGTKTEGLATLDRYTAHIESLSK